jgi:hypothetical protein
MDGKGGQLPNAGGSKVLRVLVVSSAALSV